MLWEVTNFIVNTVWDFWYTWIFLMMAIESSFIPFPSEVAMIPAWYLSSTWEMNIFLAFLAWTLWACAWATINYFLWKKLWWPIIKSLVLKYWKYVLLSLKHYEEAEKFFKKHWSVTTFNWRFIPAVRQLISIPAGVFRMNFYKFIFYTWLWAWIWNIILLSIWYIAWENKDIISEYSHIALAVVLVLIVLISFLYYFIDKHFLKEKI